MSKDFFTVIERYIQPELPTTIVHILSSADVLKTVFQEINDTFIDSYLYPIFIYWLSRFVKNNPTYLKNYFTGLENLEFICKKFINFCFVHKVELNAEKTLESFKKHNQLSDNAVREEVKKMPTRENVHLLGFGLDDGAYEKELAKFLIKEGFSNIKIYGVDPYAKKGTNIHYVTPVQLIESKNLKFDIIIARWSLHHVALKNRWSDLLDCMNQCNPNACIVFIEHGFLYQKITPIRKKLYQLLNAIFDIIANIGLRPSYFTQTAPNFGANFFIRYLDFKDYTHIINNLSCSIHLKKIYEIGPSFPNQTIFSFHISQ
ncbi:MAG: methyltransferase domain-containing protein [Rickettsiella sp.]|nr:methyltransferase domain-containing protein [Rickettsiella sp.]